MISITNEDNMVLMARYPDKYFDLAIVDPEYGLGIAKSGSLMKHGSFQKGFKKTAQYDPVKWDSKTPDAEYFKELFRVSKVQIIFGANFFLDFLPPSKSFLVWNKKGNDRNPNFSPCELIWSNSGKLPKIYDVPWLGFGYLNNTRKQRKIHPTEKPIELYKMILEDHAKPGDRILDTHLGSGSIAIACHDYGFDLTACEIDKDYFDKAMDRINDYQNNPTIL